MKDCEQIGRRLTPHPRVPPLWRALKQDHGGHRRTETEHASYQGISPNCGLIACTIDNVANTAAGKPEAMM